MDLEHLDFSYTRTFRVEECPVCGSGPRGGGPDGGGAQQPQAVAVAAGGGGASVLVEELCGRGGGRRTFSLTPSPAAQGGGGNGGGSLADADLEAAADAARRRGLAVEPLGDMGLSVRSDDVSVSIMKHGSAVVVGTKDGDEAVRLYRELLAGE